MSAVAGRYAKALFDLGVEAGSVEKMTEELRSVGDTVASSRELQVALANPVVDPASRKNVMAAIAQRLNLTPLARNAVLLIADHGRVNELPAIVDVLSRLADERAGRVRAEVVSAAPLSDAQYSRLNGALEKLTGRQISLVRKVDETLIGGVVTRIGDTVYDGSVRTRLRELTESLLPS